MNESSNLIIAVELQLDLLLLLLPVVLLQPAADEEDADGGGRDPERAQRADDPVHLQLPHAEHHALRRSRLVVVVVLLLDIFFFLLLSKLVVSVGGSLLGIRGALERLLLFLASVVRDHQIGNNTGHWFGLIRHDADVLALVGRLVHINVF